MSVRAGQGGWAVLWKAQRGLPGWNPSTGTFKERSQCSTVAVQVP